MGYMSFSFYLTWVLLQQKLTSHHPLSMGFVPLYLKLACGNAVLCCVLLQ
jgi:hypothetical protein